MSRVKHARRAAWVVALHIAEGVGLVLVGAAIAAALVFWRISQGPISLDFMGDELEEALADALNGDVVSIGEAQATWRQRDRSVGIVLSDVVVAESGGEILAQAPRLEADLSVGALLRADIAFSRVVVEGGEASIVRLDVGRFSAGLGSPDQVGARAASRPQGPPGGLDFLRDALQTEGSMASALRELRLEGATLYVQDRVTGVDWVAQDATLRVMRDAGGVRAEAGGSIETAGPDATLAMSLRAGPTMRQAQVEIEIANATPSRLFPSTGQLSPLSRIELPISASASAVVDDARGLLAAELEVALSAGRIRVLDRDLDVQRARAHMVYDPMADTLAVTDSEIESDLLAGRFSGHLVGAGAWMRGEGAGPYAVRFGADDLTVDMRPIFAVPLSSSSIAMDGVLYPDDLRLTIDALDLDARDVTAEFEGEVDFEQVSDGRLLPSLKLSGPITGEATVQDVLDFWPVELADGGRMWVEKAVLNGRAFNMRLDLDMPAEALVVEMLDDERLTLTFEFADAEVAFISTMSPVRNAHGTGTLRGNSFTVDMDGGEMAGLVYESGFVDIPRLNPKGAEARFGGVLRGDTSALLAFIDEPPLEFPSSFGVQPTSIGGAGVVDFEIRRAMLDHVPAEDIGYTISGQFEGVSSPSMFPGLELTGAAVTLSADANGLEAIGEGMIGPAPAHIEWRENFGDETGASTSYHVETTLDAAVFDTFAAPVRRVFTGQTDIVLDARGRGLDIASASVAADLTQAGLALPDGSWSKPAGEPADARLTLAMGEAGRIDISDAEINAPGATLAGSISLAADGRLEHLNLSRLQIEDVVDARGEISRGADGGLIVDASGAYADVRAVVEQLASGGGDESEDGAEEEMGTPLSLDVRFDRATARDGAELTDLSLALDYDGRRTRGLDFSAQGETGPITARIEPATVEGGPRHFSLEAADAGEALYTLFGVDSVRGGSLSVNGDLPALDAPEGAPTTATVRAREFVLAGAPPLAQILTIASLEGLANTLAGEGIRFARLDAPVTIVDGRITLDEAQASGPALGITVNGLIDLDGRAFDLEGVLVPAYSVNSVLGAVPVLGDLLVNRDGEGVFGLTYSIQGPFEETRVFVNPLSALAPGFLRRMFEPVESTSEPPPAPVAEEPPANAPPPYRPADIRPPPPASGDPAVAVSPGG